MAKILFTVTHPEDGEIMSLRAWGDGSYTLACSDCGSTEYSDDQSLLEYAYSWTTGDNHFLPRAIQMAQFIKEHFSEEQWALVALRHMDD